MIGNDPSSFAVLFEVVAGIDPSVVSEEIVEAGILHALVPVVSVVPFVASLLTLVLVETGADVLEVGCCVLEVLVALAVAVAIAVSKASTVPDSYRVVVNRVIQAVGEEFDTWGVRCPRLVLAGIGRVVIGSF